MMNRKYTVSGFDNEKSRTPIIKEYSWAEFVELMGKDRPYDQKKGGPCFSPVAYKPGASRGLAGVDAVTMAVFDFDGGVTVDQMKARFSGYRYMLHSSYSNTAEKPKFRVIVPLSRPVTPEQWGGLWEVINEQFGGFNDPAVKDASRIYYLYCYRRGTNDHFFMSEEGNELDVDDLMAKVPAESASVSIGNNRAPRVHIADAKVYSMTDQRDEPRILRPAVGLEEMAKRCVFIRESAKPENQSSVSEPLWKAMIANAACFENAAEWIHAASRYDPRYSKIETSMAIRRFVESKYGPLTCGYIQKMGFTECPDGGCELPSQFITKAPAGLAAWADLTNNESGIEVEIDCHELATVPNAEEVIEAYADGYQIFGKLNGGKLCYGRWNPSAKQIEYQDISSAIVAKGLTRDEGNGNWGILVEFHDPDGKPHELPIAKAQFSNGADGYIQDLLAQGLVVFNQKLLREYLMKANPPNRVLCVKQVGWHGNVFVLPHQTFGSSDERVILQTSDMGRVSIYGAQGTLEEWHQNVAQLCVGNSRLLLGLAIALSGPFLRLLGVENGGFHLRAASSSGKSKALTVGASVWGNKSSVRSWRTTDNAVESLALAHNDTFLALDELGQSDGRKAGEIAYTLGNGVAKARANRNGDVRNISRWHLLFLSTGEIGLAAHMLGGGARAMAGQEVRMLDIPAIVEGGYGIFETLHEIESGAQFANLLEENASRYYGTAGQALLQRLIDPEEQRRAVEFVRSRIAEFEAGNVPQGAHGQIHRAAMRFGLIAAVGEYCRTVGILPFEEGQVSAGVTACFDAWLSERGTDEALEDAKAIRQVKAFIERYGESRFAPLDKRDYYGDEQLGSSRSHQRTGFRKEENGNITEYWVLREMYAVELCEGFDPKLVTKALVRKGFLMIGSEGKPQMLKRIPGLDGQHRVYVIKASIMSDGDGDAGATEAEAA